MALNSTQIVQKGFIESILIASLALMESRYQQSSHLSPKLLGINDKALSPTTVLEFSFDDAF